MNTSTEELLVFVKGSQVGTLTKHKGSLAVSFAYDDEYAGIPLSLSLPVSNRIYQGGRVKDYLDGLLPDSVYVRESIGRRYGIPQQDSFDLLKHVGLDCPGAVQFCSPENVELLLSRESVYQPMTDEDIEADLARISGPGEPSWQTSGEHWSLGGQQAKLSLARLEGKWYRCEGAAATTHILKPGVKELRHQSLNECFCLALASKCGIDAAEASFEEFGSRSAISVRRFDRTIEGTNVVRSHQEDLCQALGISPALKYSALFGPSAKDILALLGKHANSESNRIVFTAQLFYNYLVGAPDAHAKNYSLLITEDGPYVSPLYDCASAYPYELEGQEWRAAMRIGGTDAFGELKAEDVIEYSKEAKLPAELCMTLLRNIAEAILENCDDVFTQVDRSERGGELKKRMLPRLKEYAEKALRL